MENYEGQSLRWARHLVGAPACWGSAKRAAEDLTLHQDLAGVSVGSLVFYDHGEWSDVGVVVDENHVLRLVQNRARLEPLNALWPIGWISGKDFREESARRREDSQHA